MFTPHKTDKNFEKKKLFSFTPKNNKTQEKQEEKLTHIKKSIFSQGFEFGFLKIGT